MLRLSFFSTRVFAGSNLVILAGALMGFFLVKHRASDAHPAEARPQRCAAESSTD